MDLAIIMITLIARNKLCSKLAYALKQYSLKCQTDPYSITCSLIITSKFSVIHKFINKI